MRILHFERLLLLLSRIDFLHQERERKKERVSLERDLEEGEKRSERERE